MVCGGLLGRESRATEVVKRCTAFASEKPQLFHICSRFYGWARGIALALRDSGFLGVVPRISGAWQGLALLGFTGSQAAHAGAGAAGADALLATSPAFRAGGWRYGQLRCQRLDGSDLGHCSDAARQTPRKAFGRIRMVFNPLCPITAAKVVALKATVLLLLTLLIKAKIRITAFSALGGLLLLLQTLAFLAVGGGLAAGAAFVAAQQRRASAV